MWGRKVDCSCDDQLSHSQQFRLLFGGGNGTNLRTCDDIMGCGG